MAHEPDEWQQRLLRQPMVLAGGWLASFGLFVIGWSRLHTGAEWWIWSPLIALAAILYFHTCRLVLAAAERNRT